MDVKNTTLFSVALLNYEGKCLNYPYSFACKNGWLITTIQESGLFCCIEFSFSDNTTIKIPSKYIDFSTENGVCPTLLSGDEFKVRGIDICWSLDGYIRNVEECSK